MTKTNIITSWDDGSSEDLRLAEYLHKYNVPSTFYIPIRNSQRPVITFSQIRELGKRFEIGAHTLNHVDLTKISLAKAYDEIVKSKEKLEDVLGKEVTKFSYPWGHTNMEVVNLVKQAGFLQARIARIYNINLTVDKSFLICPNFHFYPHKLPLLAAHCLKNGDINSLLSLASCFNIKLNKFALNCKKMTSSGNFHIWGHSWELRSKIVMDDFIQLLKEDYYGN